MLSSQDIMNELRALIEAKRYDEAWTRLVEAAKSEREYSRFLALCRWHQRLEALAQRPAKTVKVAVLGGAAIELLKDPLRLALVSYGLDCKLHVGSYNMFTQEMLNASSDAASFEPDVAVIVNTPANILGWPEPGNDLERVNSLVDEACERWLGLCAQFHSHTPCEIVLNNFHALPTRPLGNLGTKLPWEANNFLHRINLALGDRAPSYVHINDVEGLASQYGVRQWFDSRYWFHAKQPVSFECLIPYVRNTARIIASLFGRTAKCLVVDLDNTLWGGEVGDDGPEGIKIGEGDAVGEAFKAFQQYIRGLKQRGILLAVCSKNDEENARAPFQQISEMVLKEGDFAAFKANWDPKPSNLREIAAELNIGTDALVFVDDNPAEREIVRRWMPEVEVVDLSNDPADYPRLLDDAGCFEVTTLTGEDMLRAAQYPNNARRKQLQHSVSDYVSYLRSLEQRAVIRPFEDKYVERITQLTNKSNQFNLTTLRLSRSQIEQRMNDPNMLTAYVRLADAFGDNGLISVFCAERADDALHIQLWLMSCRVLERCVERLLCNYVATQARTFGVSQLHGVYVPTAKNGLVRNLLPSLGFSAAGNCNAEAEEIHWKLDLNRFSPFDVPIRIIENY